MRVLLNTIPSKGVVVDYPIRNYGIEIKKGLVRGAFVGGGRFGGLVDVRTKAS